MLNSFTDTRYMISVDELDAQLDGVTVIDARPAQDFALGHIPGAKHLDIYGVSLRDSSPGPLDAFLWIFNNLFGSRGIYSEKPVAIYDHETGERASRVVWLLAVLDHPNVKILDGGSEAWLASGRKLHRIDSAPAPVAPEKAPPTPPPFQGGRNLDLLATRFDVSRAITDSHYVIVDVRRESEYSGTESRSKHPGTIPSAVHVFWRDHLTANGALRPADEIQSLYESKGVTPDKTIIPFCHGGYRSANTFLALKALGYQKVQNYVGSWWEWGNRDDTQIIIP